MFEIAVLLPLYENIFHAREVVRSVYYFAIINDHINIVLLISDDSISLEVQDFLSSLETKNNLHVRVLEKRKKLGVNNAVENWNYLIEKMETSRWHLVLHHDERMPEQRIILDTTVDTYILSLEGNANRRLNKWFNIIYVILLKYFPSSLFFSNFIGPTACVWTKVKCDFNLEFRWYVDVLYFIKVLRNTKKLSLINIPIKTVYNEHSITKELDVRRIAITELKSLGRLNPFILLAYFKNLLK